MADEALNQLLRQSIDTILGQSGFAVRGRQSAPRAQGPHAIVNFVTSRSYGTEQFSDSNEGEDVSRKIEMNREWLFSLTFIDTTIADNDGFLPEDMSSYRSAGDLANRVWIGLARESIQELFRAAGVGLISRTNPRDLSQEVRGYQEIRYGLDVTLHTIGADEEIVRSIETLSVSGEFQSSGKSFPVTIEV